MESIENYFPGISVLQAEQFARLEVMCREWNQKINLISRQDIGHLFVRHILHSAVIARVFPFRDGTRIMDAGTGGGFPGIPLAILFPQVHFTLVDSIRKKIGVVEDISKALRLGNVEPLRSRIEEVRQPFDFITGRALMPLPELVKMTRGLIRKESRNEFPNGIIYLKGGDLEDELKDFTGSFVIYPVSEYFRDPYFETKVMVHLYNLS